VSQLLSTMVPIFGLVALGFGAVRLRMLHEQGVHGLVLFVFNFAIPALLFASLATLELPEDLEWGFVAAYYGGAVLMYALGMLVGRLAFGRDLADQAIFGMCASYSNLVMVGLPVVLMAIGPEGMLPMMLIIAFQSVTFMPITVILIQRGRGWGSVGVRHHTRIALELVKNPIIVSILVGLVVNVAGVPLWPSVTGLLDLLGASAIPCALFALGASLAGYSIRGGGAPTVALTTVKLVLHPVAVWGIARVAGLDGVGVSVAILLAAMPSAVNTYLFGARYQVAADVAARTVLAATIGSTVTIVLVLSLLGI